MPTKHPYVQAPKHLTECIARFRRSLPVTVTAATLQKLGIASKNERYVLNTLRFLRLLDEKGKPTEDARGLFSKADDSEFQTSLAGIVERHYVDLFQLHGEDAWTLDRTALVTYFRGNDQTSAIVGSRQAITFQILSTSSGYVSAKATGKPKTRQREEQQTRKPKTRKPATTQTEPPDGVGRKQHTTPGDTNGRSIGLTVRIEVNLPTDADRTTYDNIFRSIRENLLNE